MSKRTYEEPSAQVLYLKLETLICVSGNTEGLTIDDPLNPWASVPSVDPGLF